MFNPGSKVARSKYKFPRESPAKKDWDAWFNFWHNYTATGVKLHTTLGAWITSTHRRWIWYYNSSTDDLHRIEKGKVHHYLRIANYRRTRSSTSYDLAWEEDLLPTFKRGAPTLVLTYTNTTVNKLNKGVPFAKGPLLPTVLGIPGHMGRDMDVGKHRRQSTTQAQPFVARGRHEIKHTNMGHGWFVQQEMGSRLMWSRMGYILQRNRATSNRHILGEITTGEFIPGRNAWTMFPTPPRQRAFRILSDSGVGSYLVLRQ